MEEELSEFDLLAGLGVRKLLYVLRLDADRWQIADLAPPHKTRRLNRAGRTLRITPELLIAGTIGVTRPLGDPARIAGYVAAGDDRRLMRRLEADLKSLYAFYQYGTLHRHVRLRWGFLDELLPVSWPHPGDPDILDVLRDSAERRAPVALVLGSAPGWPVLAGGRPVGHITSAIHSPRLKKNIGYAMVPVAHAALGARLTIVIDDVGEREATVVPMPFVDPTKTIQKA